MRYAQGGGFTADEQERREQVRLQAVKTVEEKVATAEIARELRVTPRAGCRWRQAQPAEGPAGVASRGQAAQCRLAEGQLAWVEERLRAGPAAAGYAGQRWTLARIRDLITAEAGVACTLPGVWYLPRRHGWTCQLGARRAIERDEARIAAWKARTRAQAKSPRRPSAPGSSLRPRPASR